MLLKILLICLSLAHADCLLPQGTPVTVYGELHGSPAAQSLLETLKADISAARARVFLEALPGDVNSFALFKNPYLEALGLPATPANRSHLYGMDLNSAKLYDITAQAYLAARRQEEPPQEDYAPSLAMILTQEDVRQSLLDEESLAPFRDIFGLAPDVMQNVFTRLANENRPLFLKSMRMINAVAREQLAWEGLEALPVPDVAALPLGASAADDVDAYIQAEIVVRDRFMAEYVKDALCASPSAKPVKLSVGRYHLKGVAGFLRELLPQAAVDERAVD